jgi:hypothetical protein
MPPLSERATSFTSADAPSRSKKATSSDSMSLLAIANDDGDIKMCQNASRFRNYESSLIRQIAELFSEPDICFASTFYPIYSTYS